ncbi:MAG: Hsp33 family molecular chaperone HslO [Christensenellaceae bacterium]|nr:Hsp33 family molecular chaperone HslO [Christensenellaceae bacterium]
MHSDTIIRGLLLGQTVNVIAISGRELVERARVLHSLSRVSTAALGRTLLAVSMMSAKLKTSTDSITATISGGGPIGNITAVGHEGGIVKGYVTNPEIELPLNEFNKLDVGGAVGCDGELRVVRDFSLREPYVGRCPLIDGEIADDFANYFLTSEQQPSLVYLGVRVEPHEGTVRSAAGLILAPLPNCPEEDITKLEQLTPRIAQISRRMDDGEELESALNELFDGLGFEITERIEPAFECDCSRERLEGVLVSLGGTELSDMIENHKQAEIVCRFCNTKYQFNEEELRKLLDEAREK